MKSRAQLKAIFVRHSESTGNASDVVKGTRDYPLDAKGKRESKAIGPRIARFKPTVVITSPLSRAKEPAKQIAKAAGVKLKVDKGLLPQDFGSLEGTPRKTGEPRIRRLAMRTPDKKMPGGESTTAWDGKANKAIGRIKRIVSSGGRPAVLTHSRNLRELSHHLFGGKFKDPTRGGPEPSGFVTWSGKKKLVIHKGAANK